MKKKQRDTKKAQKKAQHRAEKRKVAWGKRQERALAALASMPLPAPAPTRSLRGWPFDRMDPLVAAQHLEEVYRVARQSSPAEPRYVADTIAVCPTEDGELDHFIGASVTVVLGLNARGLPVVEVDRVIGSSETLAMAKAGRLTMPGQTCPPAIAKILRSILHVATPPSTQEMSPCG